MAQMSVIDLTSTQGQSKMVETVPVPMSALRDILRENSEIISQLTEVNSVIKERLVRYYDDQNRQAESEREENSSNERSQ